MAGHSQFKNIMHRKGAQDAKKGKLFTKIQREITSAAKSGMPDPASNPRLRSAIQMARVENMPRDKIEAAVKRATGAADAENYENVRYEGYGAGGVAVIIEALTDNRNRTAGEIRSIFVKYNGNMGESGSVSFMFDHVGQIIYPANKASEDAMMEAAIDIGAEDCKSTKDTHEILCTVEQFGAVRDGLETKFGLPQSAKLAWIPKTSAPINEDQAKDVMKMIDALEDNDDVQEVITNSEVSEEIMAKLSAA